jgi:hypothetical protein
MRTFLLLSAAYLAFVISAPATAAEGDTAALIAKVKAVRDNGEGSTDAAAAFKALVAKGADVVPDLLAGMDDASPLAANWLRNAIEAIAERKPPEAKVLEAFIRDTKHTAAPRRLAYELLVRMDTDAPARLLPTMLDDPAAELRRDAVTHAQADVQKLIVREEKDKAKQALKKLLVIARDRDQVDAMAKQLEGLGEKVNLAAKYGFLTRWMLIGPFDNVNKAGFAKAFPPETKVDLKAGVEGKDGKEVKWIEHTSTDSHGLVDLNKAISKNMGAVGYAFTAVESKTDQPIEIRAGSNNAVKIFLNGKEVFTHDEYHHGARMDQHVGRGVLKKGRNEVLIKVCQNEQKDNWAQRWDFQLRICDAIGGAVDLKVVEPKPKK